MNREDRAGTPGARSAEVVYLNTAARATNNLPPNPTRLVGRASVVDFLSQEVRGSRLVSIVGTGGIGKTTVALAVGQRAISAFADGVWIVDFAPLRDASLVPNAIASATGLVVHSANVLSALCRFVRDRELLLVLDNCEHMVTAIAACLEQILREAPGVHALATGRTALRMEGEAVYKLPGLGLPPQSAGLTAQEALAYPAIELFVDRATDRLETFVLRDGDAPAVADICKRLDGIALALELAAMRIDVFGVKGLQKQLDDRFRLLAGRRAGLERHRTLAATLDWSHSLLSPGEARLLQAISVFTGVFRLSGASAVADATLAATAAGLAELVSKSLVSVEKEAPDASYRLLETTRAYCLERLVRAGEEQQARRRHAEYVCTVLEQAAAEWGQQLSREWGATYGYYRDDLRAALAWAGFDRVDRPLNIRLTTAGTLLWNHFSLTDESRIHLARAIADLKDSVSEGTAVEMNLQFALAGAILYTRGVMPEARAAVDRALEISEHLGETDFRLRCLRLIGTFELFYGEVDAGLRTLEAFLSFASTEDPAALAEGETHYGVGELLVGRFQSARRRMERLQLRQSRDFNDARFARFQYSNSVNVLVVLCHAQWLTGCSDTAARTAGQILEFGRQANHELSLSIALAWNSLVYLWLGRLDHCTEHVAMLEDLVEQHGIVTWRPIARFCRGAIASICEPGSPDSITALRQSICEFREIGHMVRLPFYLAVLAEALGRQGRFDEAEDTVRQALALAADQNEKWCVPEVLRIQASIASAQGLHEKADPLLQQSIGAATEIGALPWKLRSSNDLARLWQAQSRAAEAKDMLASVYGEFSEVGGSRDLLDAARLLAELE